MVRSVYALRPKQSHYQALEVDKFWTYVKKKSNEVWLIDAYDRESGEILAYVLGKPNLKTAKKLRKKLSEHGVTYTKICPDNWQSFITAFKADHHQVGKDKTAGIEGNN